jgi:hypothetical protein
MSDDSVILGLDKETFLEIMKTAASQERTIIEFRTAERDGETVLDRAMDITEHVEVLEEEQERSV